MEHGDISSKRATILGFNLETCVFQDIKKKILGFDWSKAPVDAMAGNALNQLIFNGHFLIYLFCFLGQRAFNYGQVLEGNQIPFTRIVPVFVKEKIGTILKQEGVAKYWDRDPYILSMVPQEFKPAKFNSWATFMNMKD